MERKALSGPFLKFQYASAAIELWKSDLEGEMEHDKVMAHEGLFTCCECAFCALPDAGGAFAAGPWAGPAAGCRDAAAAAPAAAAPVAGSSGCFSAGPVDAAAMASSGSGTLFQDTTNQFPAEVRTFLSAIPSRTVEENMTHHRVHALPHKNCLWLPNTLSYHPFLKSTATLAHCVSIFQYRCGALLGWPT